MPVWQRQLEVVGIEKFHNGIVNSNGDFGNAMIDSPNNPYVSPGGSSGPGNTRAPNSISQTAKTGLVITFALINGVVVVAGILSYLSLGDFPEDLPLIRFGQDEWLFLAIGGLATLLTIPVAIVLPKIMKGQAAERLRSTDLDFPQPIDTNATLPPEGRHFLGAFQSSTLIGQALFEGPAMLNAVFVFIDHNFAHLFFVAVGIAGIVLLAPTPQKLINAIEDANRPR
ncbi:hypothetical protein LOC67_19885 [Stieleria sp. JC731]|uniref:hypothetical protein n=1 Tax=Pirellulaceae TaxID=2691357 RepID=UPI001E3CD4B4|nr:hypothetical protein [Stieleria sp. JC731]MCC9602818.1 hypothetical protein [Stieleria sp. JC731]